MDVLKNLFVDSLNGFALSQVPLFCFQLLAAVLMAHLLEKVINRKWGEEVSQNAAIVGLGVALVCSIVKYSVAFSVLGATVILLLLRRKESSQLELLALVLVVAIGVGCGVGSVIQTMIGFGLVILVTLFAPVKK